MNQSNSTSNDSSMLKPTKTRMQRFFSELLKAPFSAKLGMLVIVVYVIAAVFAPIIAPYGESEIVGKKYMLANDSFILGTDNLGRDTFTRIIYGARNTVGIALITTIYAFLLGGLTGIIAAVIGGWTDQLLSRTVDILMAIPALIFAMLLLSIFGTSVPSLILIIGLLDATRVFRLCRAVSLNVVVMDFVEAAKLRGEKIGWITIREILPCISAPLAAEFGIRFCFVFLTISALSFLGLGIQPPTADWGSMVRDTADLISFEDYTPLVPAAAIAILTLGVNFVVDWFLHKTSGLKDEF